MNSKPKAQLIDLAALESRRKAEVERIEREERDGGNAQR